MTDDWELTSLARDERIPPTLLVTGSVDVNVRPLSEPLLVDGDVDASDVVEIPLVIVEGSPPELLIVEVIVVS